jgi:hypothetical protein
MYDNFDTSSDCDLCIYTLPSPGGSGKTYTIAREAHRLALQGQRVLIAQPTIDLIEKTLADEIEVLSPQVDCKAIHSKCSDNVLRDVKYRLMKQEDDLGPQGQITLITHAELIKIQGLEDREDITLYIDEVPAAEKCLLHNLFETHQLLTDNINVVPQGPIYGRVYASDEDSLEQIARNKTKDDLWKELFDTAWILLSDAWEPYVNMEQYQKLLQGEARQIIFHCVLRPEVLQGYKRVTIAGANLEDSILYHLFTQQGVTFKVDKSLTNKLRYNSHQRGDLITVCYAFPGFWSKRKQTLKSVTDDDSATNLDRVIDASKKLFAKESFLWLANKSVPSCPFGTKNAIRLPNVPHGFNQYGNVHNVAVLAASNPSPAHFAFLKSRGLTADQIRIGIHASGVYQAVLRSSIRSQSDEPKNIIVPDFETADYLANMFPDASLTQSILAFQEGLSQNLLAGREYMVLMQRKLRGIENVKERIILRS